MIFLLSFLASKDNDDSDAEFEEMLKVKDDKSDDLEVVSEKRGKGGRPSKSKSSGKAKMKMGTKNKKKGKVNFLVLI